MPAIGTGRHGPAPLPPQPRRGAGCVGGGPEGPVSGEDLVVPGGPVHHASSKLPPQLDGLWRPMTPGRFGEPTWRQPRGRSRRQPGHRTRVKRLTNSQPPAGAPPASAGERSTDCSARALGTDSPGDADRYRVSCGPPERPCAVIDDVDLQHVPTIRLRGPHNHECNNPCLRLDRLRQRAAPPIGRHLPPVVAASQPSVSEANGRLVVHPGEPAPVFEIANRDTHVMGDSGR